tara:strand:+ start:57943 stop:59589 length:1647 start_codon:yes stop_codon:yes gene_type:complete
MKKLIYLFVSLVFVFTSCNPLEDIDAALEEATKLDAIVGDVSYTLVPEDYTDAIDRGGFFGLDNEYFKSIEDVETLMPAFITDKYPALGVKYKTDGSGSIDVKSLAVITYNLKDSVDIEMYTATDADYAEIGLTSLNSNDDFNAMLSAKFPGSVAGTIVELTYQTNPAITQYTLNDDDYDFVGNGRFDNFDIRAGRAEESLDVRRVKIQTILLNNFPDATIGDKYNVTYEVFDGSSSNLEMEVILTDNAPDPNKLTDYTLTEDDFAFVGNGQFFNFDIRQGRDEETIEARRAKIETILLNNFPAAVDGDIYNVEYAVWNNQDEIRTMLLVKNGDAYDIFSALTYEFYTFALEEATMRFAFNGEWTAPETFIAEDYTAMGQRFPNFSDRETAEYNTAIYLKTLYPYATPETFLPVEVDIFRQGKVNINFVFDGANWNAIQEVIETTAQFSHNGTTWKFDNTIKYTLTQADYDFVGNGNFGNFDVREGRDEFEESVRLTKINTILVRNFPSAKQLQKYSVSYNVWKPGDDVFVMNVILDGTSYRLQTDED